MSDTMDPAVPLAEMLSCQHYKKKKPLLVQEEERFWPRGEFILRESFSQRPFIPPHFLLHHYSCEGRKKKTACPAPVRARWAERLQRTAWESESPVLGEGERWGTGNFSFHKKYTIVPVNRPSHCVCGVWRSFELSTKPASGRRSGWQRGSDTPSHETLVQKVTQAQHGILQLG